MNGCRNSCSDVEDDLVDESVRNLGRCLENFRLGEKGVDQEAVLIVHFLHGALQQKVKR